MNKIIAYTHIGDYGQAVDSIRFISDKDLNVSEVSLTIEGHYCDLSGKALSKGILSVEKAADGVEAVVDPFFYTDMILKSQASLTRKKLQ